MTQKQPTDIRVDSILSAAIEEFLEKGYDGASVNSIAANAGVSKGGLYHHFSNKEALLLSVIKKLCDPITKITERAYHHESATSGLNYYIKEYLTFWLKRPRELSFLFLSLLKSFESDILMDYYKQYVDEATEFAGGLFERAVALGEINIADPKSYGFTLMGALDGILTYAVIDPKTDIEALAERVSEIWMNK